VTAGGTSVLAAHLRERQVGRIKSKLHRGRLHMFDAAGRAVHPWPRSSPRLERPDTRSLFCRRAWPLSDHVQLTGIRPRGRHAQHTQCCARIGKRSIVRSPLFFGRGRSTRLPAPAGGFKTPHFCRGGARPAKRETLREASKAFAAGFTFGSLTPRSTIGVDLTAPGHLPGTWHQVAIARHRLGGQQENVLSRAWLDGI